MIRLVAFLWLLTATICFGANPSYTVFRGTGGIDITTNPPTGLIIIDGSGIFTSSGTNATIAVSTNGVLVAVASTNINFVTGSNVFLAATNIGSRTHIGINAFTPVPFIEGAVTNLLLTWILPILTVDSLTVSNLLAAPPLSSVQYNSNGITRGSAGFIYTNGQVRVADIVVAGQGMEVTTGSFVLNGGDTALVAWNGLGRMRWPTSGVVRLEDDAALSFNRLQLGGDTAAFPAIGRTNGDVIILGANGAFKAGDATNKLRAPAVFIANDGGMGTPLLRLENPLNGIGWDLEINSHAETYILGLGFNDGTYAMVWELNGNVGIGTTNPAVQLDVHGRFRGSSNVYFPNISSNATPVAFLATDSGGEVYETAIPTVSASPETNAVLTNIIGTVARNVTNVVSLSTTNATSKPLTNAYANGTLTLFGIEGGANVTITPNGSNLVIAATGGSGSSTNEVLTNLVGTAGRNITNFVSLSISNATSKPLTNSYAAGVVTVFGIEAGANVTATPNGSNIVIAGGVLLNNFFAMGISNIVAADTGITIRTNNGSLTISNAQSGEITVNGHSNAIPFINGAGNAFTYMDSGGGFGSLTNPGFGFNPIVSGGPQAGYGGLMVFANQSMGLLTVGHPNAGSDFATFTTAMVISNRYNSAADFKNDMVKFDAVMVGTGLRSDSTLSRWRVWQGTTSSNDVAEINLNGQMKLYGGTLYRSNTVALPTAAELGAGGYWVGVSNNGTANSLVSVYSLDGSVTVMKVLVP